MTMQRSIFATKQWKTICATSLLVIGSASALADRYDVNVKFCGPVGPDSNYEHINITNDGDTINTTFNEFFKSKDMHVRVHNYNGNDNSMTTARQRKSLEIGETEKFKCNDNKGHCKWSVRLDSQAGLSQKVLVSDSQYIYVAAHHYDSQVTYSSNLTIYITRIKGAFLTPVIFCQGTSRTSRGCKYDFKYNWTVVVKEGTQCPQDYVEVFSGDWNNDDKDTIAVRNGNAFSMDTDGDGVLDKTITYGNGDSEDQYLVGDWDGDGDDNIAVRRGNQILMNYDDDGHYDREQYYGLGNSEDQYLVGNWDGDNDDDIAVRRENLILMDYNGDSVHDREQRYGNGNSDDEYLVGDWNGDGTDNIAVRQDNLILMDYNGDGLHDREQRYGLGETEDRYLVGNWDKDKDDDIAVVRGSTVLMDTNGDAVHDDEVTISESF